MANDNIVPTQDAVLLRPRPECMDQFMPLWNARNDAEARGDRPEVDRLTAEMRQYQYTVGGTPTGFKGEFVVTHLRPLPEKLDEFMPLWEARNEADINGDRDTVEKLSAAMLPFQYQVGDVMTIQNLVTTVGKNDILDKYLKGSAYTQTFRMGLKGTGTAVVGDTQSSHASWLEQGLANAPTYTGNRKDVVMGSASAGVSTSPTQAFAITSSGTVFGCFTNNGGSATKDDTTGILFSAGDFSGGSRAVVNLDTLNVVYTLTAT
jgi:hypothetical protein